MAVEAPGWDRAIILALAQEPGESHFNQVTERLRGSGARVPPGGDIGKIVERRLRDLVNDGEPIARIRRGFYQSAGDGADSSGMLWDESIHAVLRESGRPMHINEIAGAIADRKLRLNLAGAPIAIVERRLRQMVADGEPVVRASRGIYQSAQSGTAADRAASDQDHKILRLFRSKCPAETDSRYARVQHRTFHVLEDSTEPMGRLADYVIFFMVVFSVVNLAIGNTELEIVFLSVFAAEYLLRLWAIVWHRDHDGDGSRWKSRLKYAVTDPAAIIDFIAIWPTLVVMLVFGEVEFLPVFRLLSRVIMTGRRFPAMRLMGRVMRRSVPELASVLVILGIFWVAAAYLMHAAETNLSSGNAEQFGTLPSSLWSSVVVLITLPSLTVVPGTLLGKVLVGFIALLGIGLFALPVSILTDKFREEQDKAREDIAQRQAQADSVHAGAMASAERNRDNAVNRAQTAYDAAIAEAEANLARLMADGNQSAQAVSNRETRYANARNRAEQERADAVKRASERYDQRIAQAKKIHADTLGGIATINSTCREAG